MSVKENDELYDLIHSLTKAERRYFKLYFQGTMHGEMTKYIKVFDVLADLKTYSKAALEKKVKNPKLLQYFSKTKAYLTEAILDAMRVFYKVHSQQYGMYDSAADVRFLLNKGLIPSFKKLLTQTKQQCYDAEKFIPLLDLLETEESYLTNNLLDTRVASREVLSVLSLLKQEAEVLALYREVYALYQKVGIRPDSHAKKRVADLLTEFDTKRPDVTLQAAKIHFNDGIALCYHILGDNLKGLEYLFQSSEVYIHASSRFMHDRRSAFLRLLGNIHTYAFNHRDAAKYREVCAYIDEKKELVQGHEAVKFELMASQLFCEISLSGDYSTFRDKAEYIEKSQALVNQMIPLRRGDISFNISLGYFRTGSPDLAVKWLLRVFDVPSIEERTNVYLYARMYEILLHWRLDNIDLVISRTLSFKRYLVKTGRMGELEKALIKFVNSTAKNDSNANFKRALQSFNEDLQMLDKTLYAGIVSNYTELVAWFTN